MGNLHDRFEAAFSTDPINYEEQNRLARDGAAVASVVLFAGAVAAEVFVPEPQDVLAAGALTIFGLLSAGIAWAKHSDYRRSTQ